MVLRLYGVRLYGRGGATLWSDWYGGEVGALRRSRDDAARFCRVVADPLRLLYLLDDEREYIADFLHRRRCTQAR